ncbi:MAG: DUF5665 domain-containing protein [Weeksellaceae bacterium]
MTKDKKTNEDKDTAKKLEILIQAVDRVYPSKQTLMIRSFIQGVFTALGATVGLTIVLAILTFVLAQLRVVPVLNTIIDQSQIESIFPQDDE